MEMQLPQHKQVSCKHNNPSKQQLILCFTFTEQNAAMRLYLQRTQVSHHRCGPWSKTVETNCENEDQSTYCVCVCVCVYVCACACVCMCMCVCMCLHVHVHVQDTVLILAPCLGMFRKNVIGYYGVEEGLDTQGWPTAKCMLTGQFGDMDAVVAVHLLPPSAE